MHAGTLPVNSPMASHKSDEEDLDSVSASESELIEDDTKSLHFGKSLFGEEELQKMVSRRIVERNLVRLPTDEEPTQDKCVVFKDQFTAGLRFPVQDLLE